MSRSVPRFYGGLVIETTGKVITKNLALPIPWYARTHKGKIEQIFEDGVRVMLPHIVRQRVAFAEGTEDLQGVKTWLLMVSDSGPVACIVTDLTWPIRGAYHMLIRMLDGTEPASIVEHPDFIHSTPPEDSLDKVNSKLVDVKRVLQDAIVATLDRGEKLDVLVKNAENLSATATRFYTEAKRVNRCCFGLF